MEEMYMNLIENLASEIIIRYIDIMEYKYFINLL